MRIVSGLLVVGCLLMAGVRSVAAEETPRGVVRVAWIAAQERGEVVAAAQQSLGNRYLIRTFARATEEMKAFRPQVAVVEAAAEEQTKATVEALVALATGPRVLLCVGAEAGSPGAVAGLKEWAKGYASKNVGVVEVKSPASFVASLTPHIRNAIQRPEEGYILRRNERTLEQANAAYAEMPKVAYEPPAERWTRLPRTEKKLRDGGELRVVMLGDSIVNDTSRSAWDLVLQQNYPKTRIEKITSVRGSTGCWWYREGDRVRTFVLDWEPDLVILGGISQRDDVDSIRQVIRSIRMSQQPDILLMTGAFGSVDPRDDKQWNVTFDESGPSYRAKLSRLAREERCGFLDMTAAWGASVRGSGKGLEWFKRDPIHANARGEQILGRVLVQHLTLDDQGN